MNQEARSREGMKPRPSGRGEATLYVKGISVTYAMAKNVASPPRSSWVTDEPRREMRK
ncbi:hypothetical protein GCM10009802_43770 [Streptomyces synnematoformans]|uniref:Uncharacterized protein n=1 Tax=Streptomyces synnematoformans TaxID=415721 RepID=A0ABN2Z0W7_9ACTN